MSTTMMPSSEAELLNIRPLSEAEVDAVNGGFEWGTLLLIGAAIWATSGDDIVDWFKGLF